MTLEVKASVRGHGSYSTPRKRNQRRRSPFTYMSLLVAVVVTLIGITIGTTDAIDVKWTPNPNDDAENGGGPLPLSSNQRQQLLQLEQTIMNSPDPQATLEQVATTNSMKSEELYNLLRRNHDDMAQQSPGSGREVTSQQQRRSSTMITTIVWNTITAIVGMMWQMICRNPKLSSMIALALLSTLYISTIVVPQNGLSINQYTARKVMITKGPTTIFYPPTSYIQQRLLMDSDSKLFHMMQQRQKKNPNHIDDVDESSSIEPTSSPRDLWKFVDFSKLDGDTSTDDNGTTDRQADIALIVAATTTTTTWRHPSNKNKKKNKVQLVVTSQFTMDIRKIVQAKVSKIAATASIATNDDDTTSTQIQQEQQQQIFDWCIYHAANIFQTQDITEFLSGVVVGSSFNQKRRSIMKMFSNNDGEEMATRGVMIVPGLGDFGRYGVLPLLITTNANDDLDEDCLYLTLTVAQGAHFDGQIHISIHPFFDKSTTKYIAPTKQKIAASPIIQLPNKFTVRASIIVPANGKVPNIKIAQRMTSEIVSSIVQSIQIRVQQSMVRSKQSNTYSRLASQRAINRRKNRTTLERQMEEMAIDRRRKWQRKHPSGTSNYRPSGERMRHPNNAMSHR